VITTVCPHDHIDVKVQVARFPAPDPHFAADISAQCTSCHTHFAWNAPSSPHNEFSQSIPTASADSRWLHAPMRPEDDTTPTLHLPQPSGLRS
jgi:hypothetical protein